MLKIAVCHHLSCQMRAKWPWVPRDWQPLATGIPEISAGTLSAEYGLNLLHKNPSDHWHSYPRWLHRGKSSWIGNAYLEAWRGDQVSLFRGGHAFGRDVSSAQKLENRFFYVKLLCHHSTGSPCSFVTNAHLLFIWWCRFRSIFSARDLAKVWLARELTVHDSVFDIGHKR